MYISTELEITSQSKIVSNCFYKKNHIKSCFLKHINHIYRTVPNFWHSQFKSPVFCDLAL